MDLEELRAMQASLSKQVSGLRDLKDMRSLKELAKLQTELKSVRHAITKNEPAKEQRDHLNVTIAELPIAINAAEEQLMAAKKGDGRANIGAYATTIEENMVFKTPIQKVAAVLSEDSRTHNHGVVTPVRGSSPSAQAQANLDSASAAAE
eukprot:5056262-Karenia_brevis.AAC.1